MAIQRHQKWFCNRTSQIFWVSTNLKGKKVVTATSGHLWYERICFDSILRTICTCSYTKSKRYLYLEIESKSANARTLYFVLLDYVTATNEISMYPFSNYKRVNIVECAYLLNISKHDYFWNLHIRYPVLPLSNDMDSML